MTVADLIEELQGIPPNVPAFCDEGPVIEVWMRLEGGEIVGVELSSGKAVAEYADGG